MKPGKLLPLFLFITFSLTALVGVSSLALMYFFRQQDKMAYGVEVAGYQVTGMSQAEVKGLLQQALAGKLQQDALLLTHDGLSWHYKAHDLGLQPDLDGTVQSAYAIGRQGGLFASVLESLDCALHGRRLPLLTSLDEDRFRQAMAVPAQVLNHPPRNAVVYPGARGIVHEPAREGIELDVNGLLEELRGSLLALRLPIAQPALLQRTAPEVTDADLQEVDTILSTYSTDFFAASDRGENVRIAASRLNGVLVRSGEEFSFNEVVGPRDASHGFLDAPVIIAGRVEPGSGGGVCQVSSTLYNAILLAGLTPTERQPHFYPSGYVPAGLDATVAYGLIDFCFRNDLPHPVVLQAAADGNELTCQVLGTAANLPGDIDLLVESPRHNVYISYRVYSQPGQQQREHLYTDEYDDPLPPEPEPPQQPQPQPQR